MFLKLPNVAPANNSDVAELLLVSNVVVLIFAWALPCLHEWRWHLFLVKMRTKSNVRTKLEDYCTWLYFCFQDWRLTTCWRCTAKTSRRLKAIWVSTRRPSSKRFLRSATWSGWTSTRPSTFGVRAVRSTVMLVGSRCSSTTRSHASYSSELHGFQLSNGTQVKWIRWP